MYHVSVSLAVAHHGHLMCRKGLYLLGWCVLEEVQLLYVEGLIKPHNALRM